MKIFLTSAVFLGLSIFIPAIPSIATQKTTAAVKDSPKIKEYIFEKESADISDEPYLVLNCSTGEITEVSVRDYVIGAVAAEMPASFGEEALKAQAVAAHTYAERQRNMQKKFPDKGLGNADFSDDPNKYQGFFTNEMIRHYFGDNYEIHYNKIAAAVDEVLPYIITYENEPIIAAFHSMSSGKTESAENVWGTAVDYLIPAESQWDKEAAGYTSEVKVSADFVKSRLEKVFEGIQLADSPEKWIKTGEKSDSGTVLEVTAGDKTVTGNDIRETFGLRSADFTVEYSDGEFIFTTHGYGHGVGMSQYGADDMAKNGNTWQEIINHYYNDCEIEKIG